MSDLRDIPFPSESRSADTGQRFTSWKLCRTGWPRRCVLAFLLFLLLVIEYWRDINVFHTLVTTILLGERGEVKYNSLGNWTIKEIEYLYNADLAAVTLAQLPGAILIYKFSSHKFLLAAVVVCSVLHLLTPTALHHHSVTLVIILLSEGVIAAPIKIAVMSIWKDWAPPLERTTLITFSFSGCFIGYLGFMFYQHIFLYLSVEQNYYLSGIAGLAWALFWYCSSSNAPQSDQLISENEYRYLEGHIPSDNQQKIELRNVPWISILTSKQVIIICIIFFKLSYSLQTVAHAGVLLTLHLTFNYNTLWFFVPFAVTFVLILPCSAILTQHLIKKFSGQTLSIRKRIIGVGFSLQCVFLLGTLAESEVIKTVFFMISYICFVASIPGFITIPMDLSPRYVSITAGLVFTLYYIGKACQQFFMEFAVEVLELQSIGWLFFLDVIISIVCMILFLRYGEVEEQAWSQVSTAVHKIEGFSHPKSDERDGSDLATETV